MMLLASFGDLPTVYAAWQHDVRDEDVGRMLPDPRKGLAAVGRLNDVESFVLQLSGYLFADERITSTRSTRTDIPFTRC